MGRAALASGVPWAGLAAAVAVVVRLTARSPGGAPAAGDDWAALVRTGDALARGEAALSTPRTPSARAAYLLAFHHAQDAGDPEHVLAVADRLERLGERALAAHVRRAAGGLLEEHGAPAPAGLARPP